MLKQIKWGWFIMSNTQYFEMGRVEWLRNIGISYKWMEENGIMLPVVSLNINYKTSRYDDLLTVKTIF
jgi:acyl-CoA thioester hydrolase